MAGCLEDIQDYHCESDASDCGVEVEETSFVALGVVVAAKVRRAIVFEGIHTHLLHHAYCLAFR